MIKILLNDIPPSPLSLVTPVMVLAHCIVAVTSGRADSCFFEALALIGVSPMRRGPVGSPALGASVGGGGLRAIIHCSTDNVSTYCVKRYSNTQNEKHRKSITTPSYSSSAKQEKHRVTQRIREHQMYVAN